MTECFLHLFLMLRNFVFSTVLVLFYWNNGISLCDRVCNRWTSTWTLCTSYSCMDNKKHLSQCAVFKILVLLFFFWYIEHQPELDCSHSLTINNIYHTVLSMLTFNKFIVFIVRPGCSSLISIAVINSSLHDQRVYANHAPRPELMSPYELIDSLTQRPCKHDENAFSFVAFDLNAERINLLVTAQ